MNKKRILFLIYNLNGGGAEKVLLKVLEKINLNKFKVDLFLIKKEKAGSQSLLQRLFFVFVLAFIIIIT